MAESYSTEEANNLNQAQIDQFRSYSGKSFSTEEWNTINQPEIDQFRANNGTMVEGVFKGAPILLLTTSSDASYITGEEIHVDGGMG
jgi:NAD(P)-dependent dehydrogenase (short-subunit alcohol dehydrogenase family)